MKEQKLPQGQSIIGFDSMEEMVNYLDDAERQAVEQAVPQQWAIDWGAYVLYVSQNHAVFGHVYTEAEFLGEDPDEIDRAEWEVVKRGHQNGYRYGKWYSTVVPKGEFGTKHVAILWEITQADYEAAEQNDWEMNPELALKVADQIRAAIAARGEADE